MQNSLILAGHFYCEFEPVEEIGSVDPGSIELCLGCQIDQNFLSRQITHLMERHFHVQWLIQVGIQFVFPNP